MARRGWFVRIAFSLGGGGTALACVCPRVCVRVCVCVRSWRITGRAERAAVRVFDLWTGCMAVPACISLYYLSIFNQQREKTATSKEF